EAWRLMRRMRIRHVPVVDARQHLVGLVTHRDLLAAAPSATDQPQEASRLLPLAWHAPPPAPSAADPPQERAAPPPPRVARRAGGEGAPPPRRAPRRAGRGGGPA